MKKILAIIMVVNLVGIVNLQADDLPGGTYRDNESCRNCSVKNGILTCDCETEQTRYYSYSERCAIFNCCTCDTPLPILKSTSIKYIPGKKYKNNKGNLAYE